MGRGLSLVGSSGCRGWQWDGDAGERLSTPGQVGREFGVVAAFGDLKQLGERHEFTDPALGEGEDIGERGADPHCLCNTH